MTVEALQANLLRAMADFVCSKGRDVVSNLAGSLLNGELDRIDVPTKDQPAVAYLSETQETLLPAAQSLFQAFLVASPTHARQISYKGRAWVW
jgi:hypothetical protein